MRYFELHDDMSPQMQWRWHIGEIFLPDGSEPRLRAGIRLIDPRPLHANVTHVGHVLHFCHTSFAVPVASESVANAVKSIAHPDVQCLAVTIAGQSGMMVLNAVRVIRCVDERRSEFDKWTERDGRPDKLGQYRYISKLVLDQNSIPPDAHFFRVKDWLVCLVVSQAVKDAMERVGCNGAKFTELEMV